MRSQFEADQELRRIDELLGAFYRRTKPEMAESVMDASIDMPCRCARCDKRFVDKQTYRRLAHGCDKMPDGSWVERGDYHFPNRCPKCVADDRQRVDLREALDGRSQAR